MSAATQNDIDGQETPTSGVVPSMFANIQAAAPPAGSFDLATLPAPSTATQNEVAGQDGDERPAESILVTVQEVAPPIGVRTLPPLSVITQDVLDGQAIPDSAFQPSTRGVDVQAAEPPVGVTEVSTSPPSTATQSEFYAHETPAK